MADTDFCVALAAEIVAAYLAKNSLLPEDLPALLRTVHGALKGATGASDAASDLPAVPIQQSVVRDYVVCLVCGTSLKALKRHLRVRHALAPDAYRARFKLSIDHPLVAPHYSEVRSRLAVASGLGHKTPSRRRPLKR